MHYVLIFFLCFHTFSKPNPLPSYTTFANIPSPYGQRITRSRTNKSQTFAANVRKHNVVPVFHYFIFMTKKVYMYIYI